MSMKTITHIVLHYSATFEDQDIGLKEIREMHLKRGFKREGYHWIIRRDGTIEQGRPESMVGAHVGGLNSGKIGICCIGGLNRKTGASVGVDNRTAAQISASINLIRDILKRHPGAQVVGHKDLAPTQCPGFDVRRWWAVVQNQPRPTPAPVEPTAPATTPGVKEDDFHLVESGDTWWGIADEHGLSVPELLALNNATEQDILQIGELVRVETAEIPSSRPPAPSGQSGGKTLASIIAAFIARFFGGRK